MKLSQVIIVFTCIMLSVAIAVFTIHQKYVPTGICIMLLSMMIIASITSKPQPQPTLYKGYLYTINDRFGRFELTTLQGDNCFFMLDTNKYEYFILSKNNIKETTNMKTVKI